MPQKKFDSPHFESFLSLRPRHINKLIKRILLGTLLVGSTAGSYVATQEHEHPGFVKDTLKSLIVDYAGGFSDAPTQGYIIRFGQRVKDQKSASVASLFTITSEHDEQKRKQLIDEEYAQWETADRHQKNLTYFQEYAQELITKNPDDFYTPTTDFGQWRAIIGSNWSAQMKQEELSPMNVFLDFVAAHQDLKASLLQKNPNLVNFDLTYAQQAVQFLGEKDVTPEMLDKIYILSQRYNVDFFTFIQVIDSCDNPSNMFISDQGFHPISFPELTSFFDRIDEYVKTRNLSSADFSEIFYLERWLLMQKGLLVPQLNQINDFELLDQLHDVQKSWQLPFSTFRETIYSYSYAAQDSLQGSFTPTDLKKLSFPSHLFSTKFPETNVMLLLFMNNYGLSPETQSLLLNYLAQAHSDEARSMLVKIVFEIDRRDQSLFTNTTAMNSFFTTFFQHESLFHYAQEKFGNKSISLSNALGYDNTSVMQTLDSLIEDLQYFQEATQGLSPQIAKTFPYELLMGEITDRSSKGLLDQFSIESLTSHLPHYLEKISDNLAIAHPDVSSLEIVDTQSSRRNDFTLPTADNAEGGFFMAPFFVGNEDSIFVYSSNYTDQIDHIAQMDESAFQTFLTTNQQRDVIAFDAQSQPYVFKFGALGNKKKEFLANVKKYQYLWTYNPLLDGLGNTLQSESVSFSESETRWQLVITENAQKQKDIYAALIRGNISLDSQLPQLRAYFANLGQKIVQVVQMDVGSINFIVLGKDQFLSGTQMPGILSEGQKYFYLAGKFEKRPSAN